MSTTATNQIHFYMASHQPAHRFFIYFEGTSRHWVKRSKRSLVSTKCCDVKRWAGNCWAQAYYDGVYFFCRKGHGCRS
jgi:hypothetical protein